MQPMGSTGAGERRRVETVVETLAAIAHHGDTLGELAHDARNMVTALSLYCDLLEEPGVLSARHRHYGSELRLVAEASRGLVEKLALLDEDETGGPARRASSLRGRLFPKAPRSDARSDASSDWAIGSLRLEPIPSGLIDDLREELRASRNLLAAMAGPSIAVTVEAEGGAQPILMTSENLIRTLVNLVKNAAECMHGTGAIRLRLADRPEAAGERPVVVLTVEDSGCGIAKELMDKVFEAGFTTRAQQRQTQSAAQPATQPEARPGGTWEPRHRGLGLAITRSIVEAAGGTIRCGNRPEGGARFEIELPVRIR